MTSRCISLWGSVVQRLSTHDRRTKSWEELESAQERIQLIDNFVRWLEGEDRLPFPPDTLGRLKAG